jgi:hypothetical protein
MAEPGRAASGSIIPAAKGEHMRIANIRTITGPNVFSHKPVLVMTLDLEELAGKEPVTFPVSSIAFWRFSQTCTSTTVVWAAPGGLSSVSAAARTLAMWWNT